MQRISVLDGWRGLSIVLVLMTHWLPLRHVAKLDHLTGTAGMALFFCMSGFLMASILDKGISLKAFWARRAARIVPLAWASIIGCWIYFGMQSDELAANLLFVANIPPIRLVEPLKHLWSLCTEMQFYVFIGVLWSLFGKRSLPFVIALFAVLVINKTVFHTPTTGSTIQRVDEIFAGFLLFFALKAGYGRYLRACPWWWLVAGFLASCMEQTGHLNGLRSLFAASMVGLSIDAFERQDTGLMRVFGWLRARWLRYMAEISYAAYVLHPILGATWLGEGDLTTKYLKRPLLLAALIGAAHLSTRFLEPVAIRWAKRVN